MDFCTKHNIKLLEHCPKCLRSFSKGYLTVRPCCSVVSEIIIETEETKLKKRLLSEFIYIKEEVSLLSNDTLYQKIMILFGLKGYIGVGGNIFKSKIINDFLMYYDIETLNSIGIDKDLVFSTSSSVRLLNKDNMVNYIIFYILLIIFLSGSIKNFINNSEGFSNKLPFGSGPWPCHNPICPSSDTNPIRSCKRIRNWTKFTGVFTCPECGFIYSCNWEKEETQKDNKNTVKSKGYIWMNRVCKLYAEGYNYSDIAKVVKSDKSIVTIFLINLRKSGIVLDGDMSLFNRSDSCGNNLYEAFNEVAATNESVEEDTLKDEYREKILQLKKSIIHLKRKDAYKEFRKEYTWLFKNDFEWLNKVLPPVRGKKEKLNYNKLDNKLKIKVKDAAKEVFQANPNCRIKKYMILNKLNQKEKNQVISHLNKLPKTKRELESHIESIDDYQVRHVPSLFSQLKSAGYVNVTFNSILSFRRSYRSCTEETKKKIEKVLNDLQEDNK